MKQMIPCVIIMFHSHIMLIGTNVSLLAHCYMFYLKFLFSYHPILIHAFFCLLFVNYLRFIHVSSAT